VVLDRGEESRRYVEVEPLLFEAIDGDERLAAVERDGRIEYVALESNPTGLGREEWLDGTATHALTVLFAVVLLLTAVLGWPAASLFAWIRSDRDQVPVAAVRRSFDRPETRSRLVAVGSMALLATFPVLVVGHYLVTPYAVLSEPPVTFQALFAVPIGATVGTLVAFRYGLRSWLDGYWSLPGRVHYSLVVAALALLCVELWFWNLLFPPL